MKKHPTPRSMAVITMFSLLLFLCSSGLTAQNMSVNPDVINLNAQGNYENIQCVYGFYMPSGYHISAHNIQVSFNGTYVQDACLVTYCLIDNNLFVEFKRLVFQLNPVVIALANLGPKVLSIYGTFTVADLNGNNLVFNVDRWGYAEIIKPGKK